MSPMTLLMHVGLRNSTAYEVVSSFTTRELIQPRALPLTSGFVHPCLKLCRCTIKLLDSAFCTRMFLLAHSLLVALSYRPYSSAVNWKWILNMDMICPQCLGSCCGIWMLFLNIWFDVALVHFWYSLVVPWKGFELTHVILQQCLGITQTILIFLLNNVFMVYRCYFPNSSLTVVVSHGCYSTTVPRQLPWYLHAILKECHENTTSKLILLWNKVVLGYGYHSWMISQVWLQHMDAIPQLVL